MARELPKTIKAFVQHGVRIAECDDEEATGTCPFCNKARHFNVSVGTQLWKCFAGRCGRHGNFSQFLRRRLEWYRERIEGQPLKNLAQHRRLSKETITRWGIGYDPLSDTYMVPMYAGGKVVDIHRYDTATKQSLSTSTGKGGLFILSGDVTLQDTVTICEGQWDTLAYDEALRDADRAQCVVGVAGAKRIPKNINEVMTDKRVILAFDKDKDGAEADERCRKLLAQHPKSIESVHWPKKRPLKWDVRDLWMECGRSGKRFFEAFDELLDVGSAPAIAAPDEPKPDAQPTVGQVATAAEAPKPTGKGMKRSEVIDGYRKWLYIPDTDILDVAFGTAFANRLPGRPLWLFFVGPPGGLKTEIIQSFGDSITTSLETDITRQALVSGMQTLSGNDPSLIPAWNGRLVLIADFTTILSMNQLERDAIFGVLRSAYDGRYEKKFGNHVHRLYRSTFGILAGVTPVVETFSVTHPVLGERFVKYYVHEASARIQQDSAAVGASFDNLDREDEMQDELRRIAKQCLERKIDTDKPPTFHPELRTRFILLAQWAAAMRGVVSRDKYRPEEVLHRPVTELGTRLVKQLPRLAQGIALFRRKREVGFDEFRIAAQIARNSAPDRRELIVRHLYLRESEGWFSVSEVMDLIKFPKRTVEKLLADMVMLHLLREQRAKGALSPKYRLSSALLQTMQPLDLYTKEAQWRRAVRHKDKPREMKRVGKKRR